MPKDINVLSKIHVRVDAEQHAAITGPMHHGQLTQLMKCIFAALYSIDEKHRNEVINDFIYKNTPLVLTVNKGV
jgi:hypothetical protein